MKHFRPFFTVQSSSNEVKVSKHTVNSLKIISQSKTFDCLGDHQNIEIIDLKKSGAISLTPSVFLLFIYTDASMFQNKKQLWIPFYLNQIG